MLRVPFKPNRRDLLAGTAAAAAVLAAPSVLRAEQAPLKVGVLLPRSGFEAEIGQDCQRGVDVAPAILDRWAFRRLRSWTPTPNPMSTPRALAPRS